MRELKIALLLVAASLAAPGWSQIPACDALAGPKRELAQRLLQSEHPYDCCDDPRSLPCRPSDLRARGAVGRERLPAGGGRAGRGPHSPLAVPPGAQHGGRRRRPLSSTLDPATSVGRENAPVTLVVYACARCPYCSKLVPALVQEVRAGRLEGRVRLVFRTFPIRGHEGSTEGGLAFAAAAEWGRFWEFVLLAYQPLRRVRAGAAGGVGRRGGPRPRGVRRDAGGAGDA